MRLLNHNLQAFMAIVQQSTVHGAANKLGLTQTAVTQRIRSIERDLETTLFIRSRKGMKHSLQFTLPHPLHFGPGYPFALLSSLDHDRDLPNLTDYYGCL